MAYRVETNKTTEEMFLNFVKFIKNPVTLERVDYSSSTGNGNIEGIDFDPNTVVTESWTLQCTDDTNFIFSVTGSVSGSQADAQLDVPYDNGIISFTIRQGSQTWAVGDIVVIYVKKGTTPPMEVISQHKETYYYKAFVKGNTSFTLRRQSGVSTAGITAPSNEMCAFRALANKEFNDYSYSYQTQYNTLMIDEFYDRESTSVEITSTGENYYIDGSTDFSINIWVKGLLERHYAIDYHYGYDQVTKDACLVFPHSPVRSAEYNDRGFGFFIGDGALRVMRAYHNQYDGYYDIRAYILEAEFAKKFYDTVSSIHDWNMLTLVVDRASKSVKVYINATEIGEYTHDYLDDMFSPGIVQWYGGVAGYAVWERKLSAGEVTNIYADKSYDNVMGDLAISMGGVGAHQHDIAAVIKNKKYGFSVLALNQYHMLRVNYIASAQWQYLDLPQVNFEHNGIPGAYISGTASQYGGNNSTWFDSCPVYAIGRDPGEIIEKYWFVSDGESCTIAFKIYDPSTSQTEPVYQMLYFGETEGTKYFELPTYVGTRNAYDVWTSTSGAFIFGLKRAENLTTFLAYFYKNHSNDNYHKLEWFYNCNYVYRQDYFYQGQPTYWSKVKSINNQYPLTKIPIFMEYYGTSSQYYWAGYQPIGYINFIYQAITDNIQPEDEILIDGEKYVILKDTYRTTSDSMYALKLEE